MSLDLFAAKLRLVVEGTAPQVERDANKLFANTFATDGIKTLIREVFSRSILRYGEPEFIEIEGRWVLLSVETSRHQNITILRTIWSADGNSLTLFFKDTTFDDDMFVSGYMAVCDRPKGEEFFLAVLYH
ncbi:hypothetical protein QUA41_15065 [Microcoleus sp. Pol11C1]|uniref:hypothetical protein n=1 Tax=unclassified Microcoleus TaxID=2642155 RepID=UPI002FD43F95